MSSRTYKRDHQLAIYKMEHNPQHPAPGAKFYKDEYNKGRVQHKSVRDGCETTPETSCDQEIWQIQDDEDEEKMSNSASCQSNAVLDAEEMEAFLARNKKNLQQMFNCKEVMEKFSECKKMKDALQSEKMQLEYLERTLSAKTSRMKNMKAGYNTMVDDAIETFGEVKAKRADIAELNRKIKDVESSLEEYVGEKFEKVDIKRGVQDSLTSTAVGAAADGIVALVIACDQELAKYSNGEIAGSDCVWQIVKKTSAGTIKSGAIKGGFCLPEVASMLAKNGGHKTTEKVFSTVARKAGPVLLVGSLLHSGYKIAKGYNDGDITSGEAGRAVGRIVTFDGLSIGGPILAGALLGGPVGLVGCAGIGVGVKLGEYFVGDQMWGPRVI